MQWEDIAGLKFPKKCVNEMVILPIQVRFRGAHVCDSFRPCCKLTFSLPFAAAGYLQGPARSAERPPPLRTAVRSQHFQTCGFPNLLHPAQLSVPVACVLLDFKRPVGLSILARLSDRSFLMDA